MKRTTLVAMTLSSALYAGALVAQSFTYNTADQITNSGYVYDVYGNLTSDGSTTYTYDSANRLVRTVKGTTTTEYTYDGLGQLVRVSVNGVVTEHVPNMASALPQTLMEITGSKVVRYAHGPSGVAAVQQLNHPTAAENGIAYPINDHQGTVVRLLRSTDGSETHRRHYDAWGRLRASSGTPTFGLTLGYTGERENGDGTVYLRARHYAPAQQRFLQRDSIDAGFAGQGPQGHHRYAYVNNQPASATDPSGHVAVVPILAIGVGLWAYSELSGTRPVDPGMHSAHSQYPQADALRDGRHAAHQQAWEQAISGLVAGVPLPGPRPYGPGYGPYAQPAGSYNSAPMRDAGIPGGMCTSPPIGQNALPPVSPMPVPTVTPSNKPIMDQINAIPGNQLVDSSAAIGAPINLWNGVKNGLPPALSNNGAVFNNAPAFGDINRMISGSGLPRSETAPLWERASQRFVEESLRHSPQSPVHVYTGHEGVRGIVKSTEVPTTLNLGGNVRHVSHGNGPPRQ